MQSSATSPVNFRADFPPRDLVTHIPPFPRSYWVIPGKLLAGFYPGDKDPEQMQAKLQGLLNAGITRIINLMEADEKDRSGLPFVDYTRPIAGLAANVGRSVRCDRFPVRDVSVPSPHLMVQILAAIDEELAAGGAVYVHCWGGRGRTGTTVGCYLVEAGMTDGPGALDMLMSLTSRERRIFRRIPETAEQEEFVRTWQRRKTDSSSVPDAVNRRRGYLLGLAVGDAVGTTLEFKSPGTFHTIDDMVGGGPFGLRPGEWTDDTSMALCLAESLIECRGFDAGDQMERYVKWWKEGYLSVNGRCFDIGNTVSAALGRFLRTGDPFAGSTDPNTAGNGSIMRLSPTVLFFSDDYEKAIHFAAESSRTTHGAPAAVDGCRYLAALILGALGGVGKDELLSPRFCSIPDYWTDHPLDPAIDEIAAGSYNQKQPPAIRGTGYVAHSLEAALWAFHHSDNFRNGCLLAANLGDDADTTAAVYGQLAGAYYGEEGIPEHWLSLLAWRELIGDMADAL